MILHSSNLRGAQVGEKIKIGFVRLLFGSLHVPMSVVIGRFAPLANSMQFA